METVLNYLKQVSWEVLIVGSLRIVLILIIGWAVVTAAKMALRRMEKRLVERGRSQGDIPSEAEKRAGTLVRLLQQGVVISLWVVIALVVLRELGVEVAPILAGAGILGLAVGFGAQNLVRDVISGFFMILENQVRVGDVAVVNGTGGLVEQVNFRTIVLRDLAGTVHVFPNGTVSTMSNLTNQWSAYVFEIGVAYKEDTDRVIEIMRATGDEMRQDDYFSTLMVEDIEIFGVDAFADSAVIIKGRLRTAPIRQWEVGREYRRRLKKAFDKEGIEIPFPHRSIYFGEASKPFMAQLAEQADK